MSGVLSHVSESNGSPAAVRRLKTSPFTVLFPYRRPHLTPDQLAMVAALERRLDKVTTYKQLVAVIHGTSKGMDEQKDRKIVQFQMSGIRRAFNEPIRKKKFRRGSDEYDMLPFVPEGGRFLVTLPNGYMLKSWQSQHGDKQPSEK